VDGECTRSSPSVIITLYLTFDRTTYLAKCKVDADRLISLIKSQIVSGNIRGAITTCQATPVPLTKIIAAGLAKSGSSEHDIQQAMDEEALRELPKVEKRTGYLAMLGNLATLAGLLGTITGLIKSFGAVAGVDPSMKATMLSKGISEAMNCTAFGLGTGIFGLAAFAVLNGKTQPSSTASTRARSRRSTWWWPAARTPALSTSRHSERGGRCPAPKTGAQS
jgi:biopolymer transport protein ExbB